MRYWWVNHKQTFKEEVRGGYIWSPTKNKDGKANKTYTNLTLVQPGDLIFSYADTQIKALGVATAEHILASTPAEFGSLGKQWDNNGYLVSITWTILEFSFKPKTEINLLRDLLPIRHSPIQQNGNGNQGIYLAEIAPKMAAKLLELINIYNPSIPSFVEDFEKKYAEDNEQKKIEQKNIPKTQKEQLIMARVGQGVFKNELTSIEKECRVTKVKNISFLTASHIKPWSKSDDTEKLDGNNGLLLSPHIDRLFDQGWISFSLKGNILVADSSVLEVLETWRITTKNVGGFNDRQKIYLKYHLDNRFKG
ncbi:MAG: HNH endonuclease signature motif containing protein [Pedobacter sp.]|nr:HNH endonuclease signature motif containing protein [Pedobacter sp.]MDQ8052448.1 HNH endonuclease signature motif containing protein [Pedobacter sp.]